MSSGQSSMDFSDMKVALQRYDAAWDESRGHLDRVEATRTALASGYGGGSADTFLSKLIFWEGDFKRVVESLGRMVDALGGNTDAAVQNEEWNHQEATAIQSGLVY